MALLDDIIALNSRLFSNWDAEAVPVVVEGQPPLTERSSTWARWTIRPDISRPWSFGSQRYHTQQGYAYLQIFAPTTGTGEDSPQRVALELADAASAIFRNWYDDGLKTGPITINTIGEENGWYQVNVKVFWTSDRLL